MVFARENVILGSGYELKLLIQNLRGCCLNDVGFEKLTVL